MKKRENKEEIENQSKKERRKEFVKKEREYQSKNICNFDNFVDLLCIITIISLQKHINY